MSFFPFRSLFSKLFASFMLALVLFAIAMLSLTQLLKSNNDVMRSEILAGQVIYQIDPFLSELNTAPNRLDARLTLATIKESFDIFDRSLDAKMGLYNLRGQLLVQTEGSDLSKSLPVTDSWFSRTFPILTGSTPTASTRVFSPRGFTLFFEPRQSPKLTAFTAMFNIFTGTLLLLMIMGVASWWLARSITWRMNRLSKQMERLGEGDFSVRVAIKGKDEIAMLAKGFNQSAEKIEKLINANNLLLAHASHEFRTPITRIRLQIEMMDMIASQLPDKAKGMFEKRASAVTRDLTGLNDLIESVLLVSRLDAGHALQKSENVDVYRLIEQEVQHYPQASLYRKIDNTKGSNNDEPDTEPLTLQGQPKLLTHLIRNLLNNAMIHGTPPIAVYVYDVNSHEEATHIPEYLLIEEALIEEVLIEDALTKGVSKQTQDLDIDKQTDENNQSTSKKLQLFVKPKFSLPLMSSIPSIPYKISMPSMPSRPSRKITKQDTTNKGNYLVISVIDQGNGISEDKRKDIFSPFVRLQQEKKGSGLGLSLVAQIVEAHQGQIITDTWQGHTRFLVILPINKQYALAKKS